MPSSSSPTTPPPSTPICSSSVSAASKPPPPSPSMASHDHLISSPPPQPSSTTNKYNNNSGTTNNIFHSNSNQIQDPIKSSSLLSTPSSLSSPPTSPTVALSLSASVISSMVTNITTNSTSSPNVPSRYLDMNKSELNLIRSSNNHNHQTNFLNQNKLSCSTSIKPQKSATTNTEMTEVLAHSSSTSFSVLGFMASTASVSTTKSVSNGSPLSNSSSTFGTYSGQSSSSNELNSLSQGPNQPRKKQSTRDPLSHRMIEKRRRDRMNNCLTDLSRLIPNSFIKKQSSSLQNRGRIEKTEIIEMAIKYLKHLQEICRPLLADDGPLGPSPNSTPIPKIENDHMFTYCVSQSSNLAAELIKDRFEYYQLGFQDCLADSKRILNEAGLENLYGNIVKHIQGQFESLNIAVISKYMMNPVIAGNCDDIEIRIKTSMNQPKHSLMYLSKVSTTAPSSVSKDCKSPDIKSRSFDQSNQVANNTQIGLMPVSNVVFGSTSSNHAKSNETLNNKSQYSLNTMKCLMENSTRPTSPLELRTDNNNNNNISNDMIGSSVIVGPTTKSSSLESGNDLPNHNHVCHQTETSSEKVINKNKFEELNSLKTSTQATNNSNKQISSNESYHFKKEIKERFQKVMDRASDVSSVSSFNSETIEMASNSNSTELPSLYVQNKSQRNNNNETINTITDKSKMNILNNIQTVTESKINNLKPFVLDESVNENVFPYDSISPKILLALSSLVSSFSSPSSTLNYVPVFALHPSGHYYVPMRIEASILGFDDLAKSASPLWMKLTQNDGSTSPSLTLVNPKEKHNLDQYLSSSLSSVINEEMDTCESLINSGSPYKKSRLDSSFENFEPNPTNDLTTSAFGSTKLKVNPSSSSSLFPSNEFNKSCQTYSDEDSKPLLYPINITANITFNRAITLASLLRTIKDFITDQLNQQQSNYFDGDPPLGNANKNMDGCIDLTLKNKMANYSCYTQETNKNDEGNVMKQVNVKKIHLNNQVTNDKQESTANQKSSVAATQLMVMLTSTSGNSQVDNINSDKYDKHHSDTCTPLSVGNSRKHHQINDLTDNKNHGNDHKLIDNGKQYGTINSLIEINNAIKGSGHESSPISSQTNVSSIYNFNFPDPFLMNGLRTLGGSHHVSPSLSNQESAFRPASVQQQSSEREQSLLPAYLSSANHHHHLASQQLSYYTSLWSQQLAGKYGELSNHGKPPSLHMNSGAPPIIHSPNPNSFKMESIELNSNSSHVQPSTKFLGYDHQIFTNANHQQITNSTTQQSPPNSNDHCFSLTTNATAITTINKMSNHHQSSISVSPSYNPSPIICYSSGPKLTTISSTTLSSGSGSTDQGMAVPINLSKEAVPKLNSVINI